MIFKGKPEISVMILAWITFNSSPGGNGQTDWHDQPP